MDRKRFNPRSPFPGSDAVTVTGAKTFTLIGFNPRSPFPGSDATPSANAPSPISRVSIHAPRFRGAMPRRRYRDDRFKPTVSIHAPRFRGAMRNVDCQVGFDLLFQSTLPVSGERCRHRHFVGFFNAVSIHAPRFRGAMLARASSPAESLSCFNPRSPFPGSDASLLRCRSFQSACFNPRSPFPGSDATTQAVGLLDTIVSIHAPRFRGAMRCREPQTRRGGICFNPRSPFPGSDAPGESSRPVDKACFNPRSPFPGSDARGAEFGPGSCRVSIHAPRFRGAMRCS